MCTSVKRELVGPLIVKVIHGFFVNYFMNVSVMYWPLTVTSSARLAAPLMTVILACICLREFATPLQLVFLALTSGGAIMIVLSSPISEADQTRVATLGAATFMTYVFLFGEPFLNAVGTVMLRGLRKLSNHTVSCYNNLSSSFIFLFLAWQAGDNLLYFQEFNGLDWLALALVSILLVFAQNLYFASIQNLPAPALQPLAFMSLIYQFFFDLVLFNMEPNAVQLLGIFIVTAISAIQVTLFFCKKSAEASEA